MQSDQPTTYIIIMMHAQQTLKDSSFHKLKQLAIFCLDISLLCVRSVGSIPEESPGFSMETSCSIHIAGRRRTLLLDDILTSNKFGRTFPS